MELRRSRSLWASSAAFTVAAAAMMTITAPEAKADLLCQSYYGRICAKTEECAGIGIKQCTSYYYYYGGAGGL